MDESVENDKRRRTFSVSSGYSAVNKILDAQPNSEMSRFICEAILQYDKLKQNPQYITERLQSAVEAATELKTLLSTMGVGIAQPPQPYYYVQNGQPFGQPFDQRFGHPPGYPEYPITPQTAPISGNESAALPQIPVQSSEVVQQDLDNQSKIATKSASNEETIPVDRVEDEATKPPQQQRRTSKIGTAFFNQSNQNQ